jgi:hypothetical protein
MLLDIIIDVKSIRSSSYTSIAKEFCKRANGSNQIYSNIKGLPKANRMLKYVIVAKAKQE